MIALKKEELESIKAQAIKAKAVKEAREEARIKRREKLAIAICVTISILSVLSVLSGCLLG